MNTLVKTAGLVAALGLLTTLSPSQARAEKTLGEQCHDRGGMWVGDPINSQSKGHCVLALTASGNVSGVARCKMAGGTPMGAKCKLKADAFSRLVRQSAR